MEIVMVDVTDEQLTDRRDKLLVQLPYSEDELRKRAEEDHTASPDEREIYNELVEINFLLGK